MKNISYFFLRLTTLFLLLVCSGCELKNIKEIAPTKQCFTQDTVPFVREVWPEEGAIISVDNYEHSINEGVIGPGTGIGVEFDNQYLICDHIFFNDVLKKQSRKNSNISVILYLNGKKVDEEKSETYIIPTQITIKDNKGDVKCKGPSFAGYLWRMDLPRGKYEVTMSVITVSGICLQYKWFFEITA